jgi:hypothetical protein
VFMSGHSSFQLHRYGPGEGSPGYSKVPSHSVLRVLSKSIPLKTLRNRSVVETAKFHA